MGTEVKALLISAYDPIVIARWGNHIHPLELSGELYEVIEYLSLMAFGEEFEYSQETLLKLADQLIHNEEGFAQYLRDS
ncbi:MAG: hypothetical protein QRY71_02695 [Candidatus Rhabdochlamydia sp.]